MSRKRPSVHSDDQFALFLEKIKAMRDADQDARFEAAVSKLIRRKSQPAERSAGSPRVAVGGRNGPVQPRTATARSVRPPPPDFDGVGVAGRDTADATLMTLIGQLVFGWSNNENLLVHVLRLLLETDESSAAAVSSALPTMETRVGLVRELARLKIGDTAARDELERLLGRVEEASRLHNEFLRGAYAIDRNGKITLRQAPAAAGNRDGSSAGKHQPIDGRHIEGLVVSRNDLWELDRMLREFLPKLQASIARASRAQAKSGSA